MHVMNTNYLLITLGHNSSALFVYDDLKKVIGYEQERLSGIKGDSQFPKDAINEIINNVGMKKVKDCKIFVSHWFNSDCTRIFSPNKYITLTDLDNLACISEDITFVNENFTHHDAHAYSALSFFKYFSNIENKKPATKNVYTIVADGFGTNEEVLSIYRLRGEVQERIHRVFGYDASLGLMYQYATSFCGMKENQDEYKFLGYESHIDEYFNDEQIDFLNFCVEKLTNLMLNMQADHTKKPEIDCSDVINYKKLEQVKKYWHTSFQNIIEGVFSYYCDYDDVVFAKRVAIAHVIQNVIEAYFESLIREYEMHNVILAGGCFYNVKLNNAILNSIDGLFCVMPLAGDQGAAIGMLEFFASKEFPFGDLCYGKRRFYNADKLFANKENKGIYYRPIDKNKDWSKVAVEIATHIANGELVNVVTNKMEFGPRALGNTSTLFIPTTENTANNNRMNNRNEVMPCAPMIRDVHTDYMFDKDELERVVGSDRFMICTHEYRIPYSKQYGGAMHKMPLEDTCTGRPQIVSDPDTYQYHMLNVLRQICDIRFVVNTSFNVHGRPIAFDTTEILQNFEYQREHAKENKKPILFILDIADNE